MNETSPFAPTPSRPRRLGEGGSLGHYRLERELGRGGQGTVYLAEDLRLRRRVALKVLTQAFPGSEDSTQRFRREAEVASRLAHPGICAVLDAGVEDGVPYIAMAFVEGRTLAEVLARRAAVTFAELAFTTEPASPPGSGGTAPDPLATPNPAAPPDAEEIARFVRLIAAAARALHAAHEAGVVHRDVKPGNIMVTADDAPVVLDFGLARADDADATTLTRTGDVFGTPAYMSPEQLSGQRGRVDRRTDVFALGVALYECLTLRRPFEAPTRQALFQAILTQEPADPRRANPHVSADLRAVVATALEKDLDRRYQTAADFAEDLRRVLAREPILARPPGPLGRLVRWARRERAKAALAALLCVTAPTIAGLTIARLRSLPELERARLARLAHEREVLLADASFELTEGDPRKAVGLFAAAVAIEGPSPEAALGEALALLRTGDPTAALRRLDALPADARGGHAAQVLRADALRALGRDAESDAARGAAPPPATSFDFGLLAQRELQEAERTQHAESFRRAMLHAAKAAAIAPAPRFDAYALYAHTAGHAADPFAADVAAEALAGRWPDLGPAHYWAGFALSLMPSPVDQARAVRHFRRALELDPNNAATVFNLGYALNRLGKTAEAHAAFAEAVRLSPGYANAHRMRGDTLDALGRREEAVAAYREALRYRPDDPVALQNLGAALFASGDAAGALGWFREALRVRPDYATAHRHVGAAIAALGPLADAVAPFREAVRLDPRDSDAHGGLAHVLSRLGRYEEAAASFAAAAAASPGDARFRAGRASCLVALGRAAEAESEYRAAFGLRPGDLRVAKPLSDLLISEGADDAALDVLRAAAEAFPDDYETLIGYGVALRSLGRPAAGCAPLERAAVRQPDNPVALVNLALAQREAGRFAAAATTLARVETAVAALKEDPRGVAEALRQAKRLFRGDDDVRRRTAALAASGGSPERDAERVACALRAADEGRHDLASAWLEEAYDAAPDSAALLPERVLLHGARAALKAAATAAPDEAARLRALAAERLREELALWRAAFAARETSASDARFATAAYLDDDVFAAARDAAASRPQDPTAAAWTAFWNDVTAFRRELDRRK